MNRTGHLIGGCAAILAIGGLCGPLAGAAAMPHRNVVLLISDNHNQQDCGCYGHELVQTPHIDQLAREGVRFVDAFATTASCGPSRAVIYSGLQTHSNGQYGHGHGYHTYRLAPHVRTMFQLLRDNGYKTALLGKQHTTPAEAYPFSYDPRVNGRDVQALADHAKSFIEQASDAPFLLTIGFNDPHPTSIEPPGWGVVGAQRSQHLVHYDPSDVIVPSYLPDRPEVRQGVAGYYQQITHMDRGVGLILEVLRQTGVDDQTLVIFTSDHGSSEPGAMANHYEPGIRVPLIVRHPQGIGRDTAHTALVTLADLMPTVLDWTATPVPEYPLHGRSLLPILDAPKAEGWDEVCLSHVCHEVTTYYPMRTIRNRRYKLIWNLNWRSEYPLPIDTLQRATWQEAMRRGDPMIGKRTVERFLYRDQVELYDLQQDPDETVNLAERPEYAALRRRLSEKLEAWMVQTGDPWRFRHRLPLPGESPSHSSRQRTAAGSP